MLNSDFRESSELLNASAVEFAGCWTRRDTVSFDAPTLNLIGLEDFKTNKRAAGRMRDLADLEALSHQVPTA